MIIDKIKNNLANAFGYRTRYRYVVFESDDWGCLRMPSLQVCDKLVKKWELEDSPYNRFDSIENAADFDRLSDLLLSFKDTFGHSPVFTLNFNIANPDYEKITSTDFSTYFYESFIRSYQRINGSDAAWYAFNDSLRSGIFVPQFHGREHLQVEHWLTDLRKGNPRTLAGFQMGFFGFNNFSPKIPGYLAAFSIRSQDDIEPMNKRIIDGLKEFKRVFGIDSTSFIAPQNTLNDAILPIFLSMGTYIQQGARRQKYTNTDSSITTRQRYTGKSTKLGILELTRNVTFEPSAVGTSDWVNKCLGEIESAFFWHKPAIICTHRLNYLGGLSIANRDNGIRQLRKLLTSIIRKWPDVRFTDSVTLANAIKFNKA